MLKVRPRSRSWSAWLIACLLALFVAAPLTEGVACNAEGLSAPAASHEHAIGELTTVGHVDAQAPVGQADSSGPAPCVHGHCHHGGMATPVVLAVSVPNAAVQRHAAPGPGRVLTSADLSLDKPPPRA